MVWRLLVCGGLIACGRIAFDPRVDANGDIEIDAPDSDLVAHYRLDDDLSGGAFDSTGNGHTALCVQTCPTLGPGRLDSGYAFSGVDILTVADSPDLRLLDGFTLTAWVNYTTPNVQVSVLGKRYGSVLNSWQLLIGDQNDLFICTTDTASTGRCDRSIPNVITTNSWHHIAMAWTGAAHVGYVDGTKRVEQPVGSVMYDAGAVLIGADIDNTTPLFQVTGSIDDVRIYKRALGDAQIAALAAQ